MPTLIQRGAFCRRQAPWSGNQRRHLQTAAQPVALLTGLYDQPLAHRTDLAGVGRASVIRGAAPYAARFLHGPQGILLNVLAPLPGDIFLHLQSPIRLAIVGEQYGNGAHGTGVGLPILRTQVFVERRHSLFGGRALGLGDRAGSPGLLGGPEKLEPVLGCVLRICRFS